MNPASTPATSRFVLSPAGLTELISVLGGEGYEVLGPVVRDGAILIEPVTTSSDLPQGWGDDQDGGHYRLSERGDGAYFGFAAPAGTWKRYLFPPTSVLVRSRRDGQGLVQEDVREEIPKRALLGIRGCDLAAIAVQDRVLRDRDIPDPIYTARREGLFVVGVNCSDPAATCFCPSMDSGPDVKSGADLVLTELQPGDRDRHRFLLEAHTDLGRRISTRLTRIEASAADLAAAQQVNETARAAIRRQVDTTDLARLLGEAVSHPRWQEVADRCLSCGNCTMACPTCFCVDIGDEPNAVTGADERVRRWGSCFELSHSYMHGGSIRVSIKSRYRQWMTHKFSSWWDQFGTSGCVGCGRCIAWCPVGIDVTEEIRAIQRETQASLATEGT